MMEEQGARSEEEQISLLQSMHKSENPPCAVVKA